jgi:hypothetical protein
MGPIGSPETSVKYKHSTLRNAPEERLCHNNVKFYSLQEPESTPPPAPELHTAPVYGLILQRFVHSVASARDTVVTLRSSRFMTAATISQMKQCAVEAAAKHSAQSIKYLHTKFAK